MTIIMTLLDSSSPRIREGMKGCDIDLSLHQRAMILQCLELEKKHFKSLENLFMCDAPGTGKTYVVLSLVAILPGIKTLVVVPQHIYDQWLSSISSFSKDMASRVLRMNSFADISRHDLDGIDYSLVLTTPLYEKLIPNEISSRIRRRVYDEPQDSRDSKDSKALTWYVSASLEPDPTRAVRCDGEFIKESQRLSFGKTREPEVAFVRCRNVLISRVLTRLYHGQKLDQLFAGDFRHGSKVLKSPGEFIIEINAEIASKISQRVQELDEVSKRRKRMSQEDVDTLVKEIAQLRSALKRSTDAMNESGVCARCASPIVGRFGFRPSCRDEIHCESCSTRTSKCPSCDSEDCLSKTLGDLPLYTRDDVENNDKFDVLTRLIGAAPFDAHIIVVSAHSFETLRDRISKNSTRDRISIAITDSIVEYQEQSKISKSILMLDPTHFACGTNLEMTTDIVFLHALEKTLERQVIGRALRPPRKKDQRLNLWYLRYDAEHVIIG